MKKSKADELSSPVSEDMNFEQSMARIVSPFLVKGPAKKKQIVHRDEAFRFLAPDRHFPLTVCAQPTVVSCMGGLGLHFATPVVVSLSTFTALSISTHVAPFG